MRQILQSLADNKWFAPILGMTIGAIIFISVFGFQVVVPTNVDWLLTGGDLSQHYIGWQFFMQSDWTFPIGVASDLAYPHGLAITFMDSLPLFAIPAKLFAGVLPDQFQYFGIWGLTSYMAIGLFSALIARHFTKNPLVITSVIVLLCFSPLVFQRMFTHTALAGQWILLAAIYAALRASAWSLRTNSIIWSILLSVSVMIHPYFLPMCLFILVVSCVLRYKAPLRTALDILVPVVAAIVTTWLIGGFTFTTISGQKFGGAGYDLASPLLANGWSVLNLGLPQVRFEMFAYIGLGGLLLIGAALVTLILQRKALWRRLADHRGKVTSLMVAVILLLIVATGPTISFAGVQLFAYDVPSFIEKVWGIFRVTARLAWPLWYGVFVLSIIVLLKFARPRIAAAIIATACMVQLSDIGFSSQFTQHTQRFHNIESAQYESQLRNSEWSSIVQGKRHVVYLGDLYDDRFVNIAQFCIKHNLTLNTGYFARKPTVAIEQTIQNARQDIMNDAIDADTIYMYDKPIQLGEKYTQTELDGYFVVTR